MTNNSDRPPTARSKTRIGLSLIAMALGLQACGADRTANLVRYGSDIDVKQVVEVRKQHELLLASLGQMAGIDVCMPIAPDTAAATLVQSICTPLNKLEGQQWLAITKMGLWAIDRECQLYLDAIFWFDRAKDHTVDQIGLTAVASAAITGFTGGSSQTLSILTSAFGLIGATVENVGSGLLYDIGPSSVHEIVEKSQIEFRKQFEKTEGRVSTRVDALNQLQNYAEICLPPKIETEIRKAVKTANVGVVEAGGTQVGIGSPFQLSTEAKDVQVRKLLNSYLLKGDAEVKKYFVLAKQNGLTTDGVPQLPIYAAALVADKRNASANLKIAEPLKLIDPES